MKKLKTAIIGYGRSGRNIHTNLQKQLPELFEIAAYIDGDEQRREMIKREMNVPVFPEYTALFGHNEIDLVVNSSFSHNHAPISRDLLKHGFNVLCEKPAAKDDREFQTVLDTAAETDNKFFVFQQYRFAPGFIKIQEIIASGVLGRVVAINIVNDGFERRWDWQTVHEDNAGVLLNKGPHYLDWALALMQFPQNIEVFACFDRANYAGNGEDYVKLILRSPGAPAADLQFSACNAFPSQTFLIHGTQGTLYGSETSLKWKYFKPLEAPPLKLEPGTLRNEKGEPIYCREKLEFYEDSWTMDSGSLAPQQFEFNAKGLTYYRALHASLTAGAEFPIKNEQVMLQMKVFGSAHAQNTRLFC
ncbi:MAG: Gfo/Idh/MocA family oxidoreductase [Treponema sp.]|nr:Gfo/Idh/MocA family oxidoreductase [Treponema sp.]